MSNLWNSYDIISVSLERQEGGPQVNNLLKIQNKELREYGKSSTQ